jgi:hypothetical protein
MDTVTKVKKDRFVTVLSDLINRAQSMVERASSDKVAARELCDLLETVANLVDDHANPKPRGYVDVLVHYTEDNA